MTSKIEWTDETLNFVTGCTKVSDGCKNCYAERMWIRLSADNMPYAGRKFTDVQCHPDRLKQPLHWKKPRKIFVNSMSDLFHEDVPDEFIKQVWDVMWKCPQHTFQILTKRPERMVDWVRENASMGHFGWIDSQRIPMKCGDVIPLDDLYERDRCGWVGDNDYACDHPENGGKEDTCSTCQCPISYELSGHAEIIEAGYDPTDYTEQGDDEVCDTELMSLYQRPRFAAAQNVWLLVSIEDQETADERLEYIRRLRDVIPHCILGVSVEPLLAPISLDKMLTEKWSDGNGFERPYLDWVIVGGESGPKARQMVLGWAKDIVKQCKAADVPVFVKQVGSNPTNREGEPCPHITHRKGADMSEWPYELRVQEYPT